jgi:mevalonate kinase
MLYFSTKSNTEQLRIDELERKMTMLIKDTGRDSEDRYLRIQSNVDSYQNSVEKRNQLILDKIDRLQDELQKNKSK